MPEPWSAILNSASPNHAAWIEIFGDGRVPIVSPEAFKGDLAGEKDVRYYLLNLAAIPLKRRARLVSWIAQKHGLPIYEIEAQIRESGFPIRASDVIVKVGIVEVVTDPRL